MHTIPREAEETDEDVTWAGGQIFDSAGDFVYLVNPDNEIVQEREIIPTKPDVSGAEGAKVTATHWSLLLLLPNCVLILDRQADADGNKNCTVM